MRRAATLLAILLVPLALADLKPLDYADFARWNQIRASALSRDGKWLAYVQSPPEGDAVLFLKRTDKDTVYRIERGSAPRFTRNGDCATVTILPAKADADKAKKAKQPAPKSNVALVALSDGKVTTLEGAVAVRLPEDSENWIAVQYEPAKDKKGYALEIRLPGQAPLARFEGVSEYAVSKNGKGLALAYAEKGGVAWVDPSTGKATAIENEKGTYGGVTIDESGALVAFTWQPVPEKDKPKAAPTVKVWRKVGKLESLPVAELPKGLAVAAAPGLHFSKSGSRLLFGIAPQETEAKPAEVPDDEQVSVDVWNWKDPQIQPEQLLRAAADRAKTFQSVWDLRTNKVVRLETEDLLDVSIPANGDADFAIGTDARPYAVESTWDDDSRDVYAVDVRTGKRRPLAKKLSRALSASPSGKYAVWYDDASRGYLVADLAEPANARSVTKAIPTSLWSDETDTPGLAAIFGTAGWTKGDAELLVNDKYDVWSVDPMGKAKPRCLTAGFGKRWGLTLRRIDLDPTEEAIDPAKPLLLSATDEAGKAHGFYLADFKGGAPMKLHMEDRTFGQPTKAKDADVLLVSRQSFAEYPDLYVTDLTFKNLKRMSEANPQQAEYLWGSDELVEWTSDDGVKLQGILVKPGGFDPTKKYPMIVTFYELSSWTLHRYSVPAPMGGAGANAAFYASRGYLVFIPDVRYQVGYPGRSAVSSIVSGVLSLVRRGFVDTDHMAIVGHSWGGYETAYLVTQTNLFRCAVAGAAVSNMTSAYSGIRWGSGRMRQFQYEVGQSRIGGSLWHDPLQYIENSPIFWVDRVKTPILLLNNDKDGAVPWEQGIEFYGALRRLGKPVWLINYNGEDHGIGKLANRKDWTVRQTQFFDYYLKGAPAPVWLVDGVPAVKKGKTLGLELKK